MTHVLAVLGHPISHSLSPRMHTAAFTALGLDAEYVALDVLPEKLGDTVHELRARDALGFNVTLPHKETIKPFLDEIDEDARVIGAVNTVYRKGERFVGTNTDARGLLRSFDEEGVAVRGADVVILGAGGAARAAAFAMLRAGAESVTIAARRLEQAQIIAHDVGSGIRAMTLDALGSLGACDLLIQASSATLDAKSGGELVKSVPLSTLAPSATVIDLVYRPSMTAVLQAARERGIRTMSGVGMLVHQGALAFEAWFERPAPIKVMRAEVERALSAI